jgi:hypothetical protein
MPVLRYKDPVDGQKPLIGQANRPTRTDGACRAYRPTVTDRTARQDRPVRLVHRGQPPWSQAQPVRLVVA